MGATHGRARPAQEFHGAGLFDLNDVTGTGRRIVVEACARIEYVAAFPPQCTKPTDTGGHARVNISVEDRPFPWYL